MNPNDTFGKVLTHLLQHMQDNDTLHAMLRATTANGHTAQLLVSLVSIDDETFMEGYDGDDYGTQTIQ